MALKGAATGPRRSTVGLMHPHRVGVWLASNLQIRRSSRCTRPCDLCTVAGKRLGLYDDWVPNSSGTDKFRAFSRVVGRNAGQSRWSRATYQGVGSFLRSVGHVIRTLWHEVTGLFFLIFGAVIAVRAVREYQRYEAGQTTASRVALAGILALMFLYFALSAFHRARRQPKK